MPHSGTCLSKIDEVLSTRQAVESAEFSSDPAVVNGILHRILFALGKALPIRVSVCGLKNQAIFFRDVSSLSVSWMMGLDTTRCQR